MSPHLIVDRIQEMIEIIDADEAEPRILKVSDDEQRQGQCRRKDDHMEPTSGSCRRHTEACKQRSSKAKAKKHDKDRVRGMSLIRKPSELTKKVTATAEENSRKTTSIIRDARSGKIK